MSQALEDSVHPRCVHYCACQQSAEGKPIEVSECQYAGVLLTPPKIDISDRSYESVDNHKSLLQVNLNSQGASRQMSGSETCACGSGPMTNPSFRVACNTSRYACTAPHSFHGPASILYRLEHSLLQADDQQRGLTLLSRRGASEASRIAGQTMIRSAARSPGLDDGSVTLAVAQQIALPSEGSHDLRLEPQVLQTALEEQLHGCRVSRVLGVGGVSACFAARMESFGRVAVKISLRGSAEPHSWVAEAAEVCKSTQYAKHCSPRESWCLLSYNTSMHIESGLLECPSAYQSHAW